MLNQQKIASAALKAALVEMDVQLEDAERDAEYAAAGAKVGRMSEAFSLDDAPVTLGEARGRVDTMLTTLRNDPHGKALNLVDGLGSLLGLVGIKLPGA